MKLFNQEPKKTKEMLSPFVGSTTWSQLGPVLILSQPLSCGLHKDFKLGKSGLVLGHKVQQTAWEMHYSFKVLLIPAWQVFHKPDRHEHVFICSLSFVYFSISYSCPFYLSSAWGQRLWRCEKPQPLRLSLFPCRAAEWRHTLSHSHKLSIVLSGVKWRGPFCLNFLTTV